MHYYKLTSAIQIDGLNSYCCFIIVNDNDSTTKINTPVAKALKLPRGAKYHGCAPQVNPYTYRTTFRRQSNTTEAE
ncbi:MAG: hypothetical protein OXT74_13690 [Candidatus Poribacteria bacterium]|nr:hypothetical protein [Candidatus Poribacteria bacterium]